ncbi:hypothetical protein TA3x_003238 [Tundrisphaera sp. TA3]|uniref:hypothetical protein n=1 Tax=Tundrisphaera sp. TA3 TaxID=3435775 RepID=UPI003EBCAE56
MSQDFEFNEPQPPSEPFKPVATPPPASPQKTAAKPPATTPDPLYRSPISILGGLVITFALLGGLGFLGYDAYKNNPATPAEAPGEKPAEAPGEKPAEAPPAEAPAPATAAEPSGVLSAQVAELQAALKTATDRLDQLALKPAPDLKSVEDKLAEMAKSSDAVAGLSARVAAIDEKVGAMSKADPADPAKIDAVERKVGELASALDALKGEVAAIAASATRPAPAPDAARPPADIQAADAAMSEAVDLFRQKKYAESLERFTRLQADHPEDARVWYFSALANGLATRNWRGETERLVNLGIEKEKAGSPEASKIDAIFADLTAANGKDWLAAYRARASSR